MKMVVLKHMNQDGETEEVIDYRKTIKIIKNYLREVYFGREEELFPGSKYVIAKLYTGEKTEKRNTLENLFYDIEAEEEEIEKIVDSWQTSKRDVERFLEYKNQPEEFKKDFYREYNLVDYITMQRNLAENCLKNYTQNEEAEKLKEFMQQRIKENRQKLSNKTGTWEL
jgi:hypothetical protein